VLRWLLSIRIPNRHVWRVRLTAQQRENLLRGRAADRQLAGDGAVPTEDQQTKLELCRRLLEMLADRRLVDYQQWLRIWYGRL
jgi:hypothetical protein